MELANRSNQSPSTTTNDMAKALYHINYLAAYPVSDSMLEGWASTITELTPELTPEILKTLINRMKLGIYEYNERKGIQNVFKAYRRFLTERLSRCSPEERTCLRDALNRFASEQELLGTYPPGTNPEYIKIKERELRLTQENIGR
jgi:hypothetical protein